PTGRSTTAPSPTRSGVRSRSPSSAFRDRGIARRTGNRDPGGLLIARLRGPERPTPTILNALARPASGDSAEGAEVDRHDHRLHIRREIVKRRIETRLSPGGLTIKVDDQEFDRLADIPDPALA